MSQTNEFTCPTGLKQVNICGTVGVSGSDGIDYSFEEQWTGKYWVDGKKIYQKTLSCGPLTNKGVTVKYHDIAAFDQMISVSGYTGTTGGFFPLPMVSSAPVGVSANSQFVDIVTYSDRRDCTFSYLTIQYTCTDR